MRVNDDFVNGYTWLDVYCEDDKEKEGAVTKLKAFAEEIEKAGYGSCLGKYEKAVEGFVLHGQYVFSDKEFVCLEFNHKKLNGMFFVSY